MFNAYGLWEMAKARQKEILEAACQERLFREDERARLGLLHPLMHGVGNWMIAIGHWLQTRQKPIL